MSWFDATGLTSLAKSALKEAQRTIDKALDIEENSENISPPATLAVAPQTQTKGIQEKLKDESENFFASFGLEKKKSPLTPANSPVESSSLSTTNKDEGARGSMMVGSLWGSFTGSFFESHPSSKPKEPSVSIEEGNETDGHKSCSVGENVGGSHQGSIVAVQPGPRTSTSLPTLQLGGPSSTATSPIVPVSTQPRTASLDDHPNTTIPSDVLTSSVSQGEDTVSFEGSVDIEEAGKEWGWGWESNIMVLSAENSNLQEVDEGREASLCDDTIDEDGFASSRLVVGSVDSDGGGLARQESLNSLTPAQPSEDVFYDNTDNLCISQTSLPSHTHPTNVVSLECTTVGRSLSDSGTDKNGAERLSGSESQESPCQDPNRRGGDTLTSVSRSTSEAHTPDSIVVLQSDNSSSPEADSMTEGEGRGAREREMNVRKVEEELETPGEARKRLRVELDRMGRRASSPISSPDSIEVLGSSSIVTSPSSIEVISGELSSSDSSPTHQDSCSHTLTQDLSPCHPSYSSSALTSTQQPSYSTSYPHHPSLPHPTRSTHQLTSSSSSSPVVAITTVPAIVSTQPSSSSAPSSSPQSISSSAEQPTIENQQDSSTVMREEAAVVRQPTHREDGVELCWQDTIVSFAEVITEGAAVAAPVVTKESTFHTLEQTATSAENSKGVENISECTDEMSKHLERSTVGYDGEHQETERGSGCGRGSEEGNTAGLEMSSGSIEESLISSEGGGGGTEGSVSGIALDVSVESGGSSDTITASLDSSQLTWTASRGPEIEMSEEQGGAAVRCLLEEAMDEEEEEEDRGALGGSSRGSSSPPDRERSPSSSERSEALKVGSGHTSGHSSGDEVETTTSSDIEVISSPSLDGSVAGAGSSRGATISTTTAASRVWATAQRGFRSFLNDRSESPASDSSANNGRRTAGERGDSVLPSSMSTSFTSISESEGEPHPLHLANLATLDPDHITQALMRDLASFQRGHCRNKSDLSETSESSCDTNHSSEVEKLVKKVAQLKDVVDAREAKVLELSQVNAALLDTNLRLKSHVEELEGGSRVGSVAEESLREEFTQRLVTMERKFQQALREKEATKKLLEEARAEVATRPSSAEAAKEREEQEMVIKELREEGEKLSRQQLTYSTLLKKLRAKEKEGDSTIGAQKEKLEEQSRELERLRRQLAAKEEVERRQVEAVGHLDASKQRLEAEVKLTNQENAELQGKMEALKHGLEAAYKEIGELQRKAATKDVEAQEQALSAEVEARKQIEASLAEAETQACREQEALAAQITEHQNELSQTQKQADIKESQLRGDIVELQRRLEEAERRAEEVAGAVSAATRPLMQQMENQRSAHASQLASWETLEMELTSQLVEVQSTAATSVEKERAMREQYAELAATSASFQTQVANLRAENARLSSQLDLTSTKLEAIKESRSKESNQTASLRASLAEEAGEARRERDSLRQQLEMEKTALTAEKKRTAALQEQVKDRDRKVAHLLVGGTGGPTGESRTSTPRSSPTPSLSRISMSGSLSESFCGSQWGDEVFESGWARGTSLYDSMRAGSTATVEALTSQLRQREGEVQHLHSEVSRYDTQRESLAQELVAVTAQLEEQRALAGQLDHLKERYTEMEQRYNALLQMYGEKVEEVEELRLDLADVKEMYKLQIDELLKK
ncbi:hypothetical protein Pcinc_019571 [Petrolisthes cinctipes]|uniref:TATA element modulatory factor 1 TATA binding domain-containing protein n=1 Tax=Petrolisthes cinctipes TaxID=88211 RepID=A0AAE1FK10_PETCI|nr:hypothetical protein Pcinc_019571 [Petrolisthes cinctipes]